MSTIKKYLSLIKFSHTIFAMPFALIGFALGLFSVFNDLYNQQALTEGEFVSSKWRIEGNWKAHIGLQLLLVVLCMVFARSAAMAFNRYLDRQFDAKNPRTAIREIPAGILKADRVLLFTIVNCILFVACCWFINRLCFSCLR
nr:UbiA family prenyltransferase [Paraflavitalea speifideiaquila]